MLPDSFNRLKNIIASLIFIAMTGPVISQENPAVDRINTSAGIVDLHFIGHGSLMFSVKDYIIYFDPVRSLGNYDDAPKADLILVTHEHYDHLDIDLINDLRKPSTVLLCNKNSAEKIPWAKIMKAGDKTVVNNITIEAIPAYNIVNMRAPGQPFHPKGVGNGYILTIGDKRFYVAGDTENTPEMKALKNIDVAFLPMNLPYTMTPEMVADAAKSFNPKILYPYHYGDTNTDILVNLLKGTDIIVRIRNLK
jgi:L-ascorbate metabolism protein UlaG (beta-lactamase superfamily)